MLVCLPPKPGHYQVEDNHARVLLEPFFSHIDPKSVANRIGALHGCEVRVLIRPL